MEKAPYYFLIFVVTVVFGVICSFFASVSIWPSLNVDDVCYGLLLLFCVVFGNVYQKLTKPILKQWVATIVGLFVVFFVARIHILRPLAVTLVNAIFITTFKKYCHILSFVFTFGVLTLFRTGDYFGQPYLPGPVNLVNMVLTMRMVAVAFDAHDTYIARKKGLPPTSHDVDPGFLDVFHYAFCYAGVLTGPFFRYRTYVDLINTPFSSGAKCWSVLFSRIKMLPVFIAAFVIASRLHPLKEAQSDDFYTDRSLLYRLYYMNVNFFIFRMRMYTGILLSEAVCIAAGLGAYPVWSKPRLGTGPTEKHEDLAELAKDAERVSKEEYNFEAIRNLDWYLCEVEPTVRGAMKSWNMTVQYWLAAYVYKRFPVKSMRTFATFIMSALWHGTYIGYYLCIVSVAPYLMVEDVYDKKFRQTARPAVRSILDVVFWFCRLQGFSYMSITFQLLTVEASLRYWRSLNYIYHWIWLVLYMYPLSLTIRSYLRAKKKAQD